MVRTAKVQRRPFQSFSLTYQVTLFQIESPTGNIVILFLIANVTLSSNVIGLNPCIFYLFAFYHVIGRSVIGQLDKPITIKTELQMNQSQTSV